MGRMKVIEYSVTTRLPVKDIANAFRSGIRRPRGLVGLSARTSLDWDFFTPATSSDPFSALDDQVDEPTFTVGASYGLKRTFGSAQVQQILEAKVGGAVFLNVWDCDQHREVSIRHLGDLSPASRRCVQTMVDLMTTADPYIDIQRTKGKVDD